MRPRGLAALAACALALSLTTVAAAAPRTAERDAFLHIRGRLVHRIKLRRLAIGMQRITPAGGALSDLAHSPVAKKIVSGIVRRPTGRWGMLLREAILRQSDGSEGKAIKADLLGIYRKALRSMTSTERGHIDAKRIDRATERLLKVPTLSKRLLPPTLPSLPPTQPNEQVVQAEISRLVQSGQTNTPAELYLALEQHTANLRGSAEANAARDLEQFNGYLQRYKKTWARQWIRKLVRRAAPGSERLLPRQRPRFRLEVASSTPDFRRWRMVEPDLGFGYDHSVGADRNGPLRQFYFDAFPSDGRKIKGYHVLSKLERKLMHLETTEATPSQLQHDLARYLSETLQGYTHTGAPSYQGPLPEPGADEAVVRRLLSRETMKGFTPQRKYLALLSRSLALKAMPDKDPQKRAAERAEAKQIDHYVARARKDFQRAGNQLLLRRANIAYEVLARAVPGLMRYLPKTVTIRLDRDQGNGVCWLLRNGQPVVSIPLNVSGGIVKHLIHELAHIAELNAPPHVAARMHALRAQRSTKGSTLALLDSLIPGNWAYGNQKGFSGHAADPYMLKHYAGGATEMLSMALENLASVDAATRFFERDGAHFLQALALFR